MSFDFHARYGLLTYAQCGELDPFAVVCHLATLQAECIIGRETHVDGGIHLHAFFDLGRKRRFRKADVFDVQGHHPNIEKSRGTPEVGYDYAIKDGEVVGGGLERPAESRRSTVRGQDEVWSIIVGAETRDEFWRLCREYAPKSLCTSFNSLRLYCDWHFADTPTPYSTPKGHFDLGMYPELSEWVEGNLGSSGQTLEGNSVGKLT